ncbi:MAG: type IV toxin-antitoxin system AbiEi family antitoxin domain-containing protein [Nocardioides sp.]
MIEEEVARELERMLHAQSGAVARSQLHAIGVLPHDIARLVRRSDLVRIHPGVFLDHTGEPSWRQRAWAACLCYWPAALDGPSAVRATIGPSWRHHDDATLIHVAIDETRRCVALPGHRLRRLARYDDLVLSNASPPRVRLEDAALDAALARSDPFARIGLLADVCQSGRTTAPRLLAALDGRSRVRDRSWVRGVLEDLAAGTCSTLEHGFLTLVERPHGLPVSSRQRAGRSELGPVRRDVDYDPLPLVVELDGRFFHDTASQHDRDLDRDLDLALEGRRSVRLGWGQVYRRPCRTAARLGVLLTELGWHGRPRPCGSECRLDPAVRRS